MVARKSKANNLSIEENLQALEALVSAMEAKELPLEEALKLFEEGIRLSRHCQQSLNEAEQKVTLLLQNAEQTDSLKSGNALDDPFQKTDADKIGKKSKDSLGHLESSQLGMFGAEGGSKEESS